ncbi:CHAP domain-containing protein [Nocardia africana]|uniref:CHAP domain n=1 Tax=Nocardia africana TaxID=134964 RepID=A0A378WZ07_9NOCA|nr:CHAP domain-containing protein [Nocardia africana]MCC3313022.1 CHAP domain-containing protein [Nocardia africana]SUA45631.1 CHAP domain [Nocardia africana]
MSPSTFHLSDITLVPPVGAHKGLIAVLHAVEKALRQSIGLLASGRPSEQPDLLHKMERLGLLHDGLDDTHDFAVMVDAHASTLEKLRAAKLAISRHDEDVSMASYSTFDTSNGTFTACMTKVHRLQSTLESASKRNTSHQPLPPSEEQDLIGAALHAVSYVHNKVDSAARQIQHQKRIIESSVPTYRPAATYPTGGSAGGGATPWSTLGTPAGPGSIVPLALAPGAPGAIQAALSQLNVHEIGDNHLPGKPYNIDGPWCAAFATWAWKQAHIPLNWTATNSQGLAVSVPTIWADAQRHGLADNASRARVGDLIVLNGVGHIGLVEKVDANGTIHTIEGNSGDAVREHTYQPGSSYVNGVIHPPAQNNTVEA